MPKHIYPRAYKRYVHDIAAYLRRQMYAGEYTMLIEWRNDLEESGKGTKTASDNSEVAAQISIDPIYLSFTLRVGTPVWNAYREKDWYFIGRVICHELCHLLTEPLYLLAHSDAAPSQCREIEDTRERQTERITNAIMLNIPRKAFDPGKVGRAYRRK